MLDWLNSNGTALSTLAAITTAVVAVWALFAAVRDSHERTRPVMLAEFRLAPHNDSAFDLVVRNAGQSIARNVTVTFDPEIRPPEDATLVTPSLVERYARPLPAVGPGQELTNVWWSGEADPGGGPDLIIGEPTPDEVRVVISYEGSSRKGFTDTFDLRAQTMLNWTHSTSSTSIKGRLGSIDRALTNISRTLASLASASR